MARKRQVPKSGFKGSVEPMRPEALMRQLRAQREHLDRKERAAVAEARARGSSWKEIAEMTGMNSRQAAQYKFDRPSTTRQ